jgi:hypothetical protein
VPVESTTDDLFGLDVGEDEDLWFLGLLPRALEVWLKTRDAPKPGPTPLGAGTARLKRSA